MRKVVIIPVVAVVVLILTAAIAPYFIPTDAYLSWLEKRLTSELNTRVIIDEFRLRLIPSPGYTIKGLQLISKSPPFEGQSVVSVERIEGDLSLFGLLSGDLETRVKAYSPKLSYRSSKGLSNLGQMLGWVETAFVPPPENPQLIDNTETFIPQDGVQAPAPSEEAEDKLSGEAEFKSIPASDVPIEDAPAGGGENKLPAETGADSEKKETAPIKEEVKGPTSFNDLSVFVREAFADEGGSGDKMYSLKVKSFDIVGGEINVQSEGEVVPRVINRIDIAARNIGYVKGGDMPDSKGVFTTDIRANGSMFGSSAPNLSINGKFAYDKTKGEIVTTGARLYLMGAQASADITFKTGAMPLVFNAHVASPAVTLASLIPLCPTSINDIMSKINLQGSVAVDATAQGSSDAYEFNAQVDASGANLSISGIFFKGAGLPFKISSSALVQHDGISIRSGDAIFGDDKISFKGYIKRDSDLSFRIKFVGESLGDASIKSFFPKLVAIDSFEDLNVSLDFEGSLAGGGKPLKANSDFKAGRARLAGVSVDSFEGVLTKQGNELGLPSIRGKYADGDLSGHGSVTLGDNDSYGFEGVAERVAAEKIGLLGGALKGESSLIIKAQTEGIDPLSISSKLKLSGSLLTPTGEWQTLKMASGIFSSDTWRGLEALAGSSLDGVWKVKLESSSEEFSDLNASYELTGEELSISAASWNNSQYTVEGMKGSISVSMSDEPVGSGGGLGARAGDFAIKMDGSVIIPKGIAVQLIPDQTARKRVLDENERLILPVKISGTLKSPKYQLDHVKLAGMIEQKPLEKEQAPAGEPAKIIRGNEVKEGQKTDGEGEKTPSAKPPPEAPAKPSAAKTPKEEKKEDSEEILKVIIGH